MTWSLGNYFVESNTVFGEHHCVCTAFGRFEDDFGCRVCVDSKMA